MTTTNEYIEREIRDDQRPPKKKKRTRRRRRKDRLKGVRSKGPVLIVLDHAIVRFHERVLGTNLREVEKEIITPELLEHFTTLGDGVYPVSNRFRVVIIHNEIVTILPLEDVK